MSKSINILHITDLHLTERVIKDFNLLIRKSLKKDVQKRAPNGIDLLFITGDIVDKGGKDLGGLYQGLKKAQKEVIKTIAADLNLKEESIFIISGNHDIDRYADEEYKEVGIKKMLADPSKVNDFMEKVRKGNFSGVKRLKAYRKFEKKFYKTYHCKKSDTFFTSTFIKELQDLKIGISCLNSAWRCYGKDEGNLLLGDHEVLSSINLIENCDVKIALIHHPIDFLSEFEKTVMENILLKNYDLVFFGHSHKFDNYSKTKGKNQAIWIGSTSAFFQARTDSRKYASGYAICNLNEKNTEIQYTFYSYKNTEFRTNTEIGEEGINTFHSVLPKIEKDENPVSLNFSFPNPVVQSEQDNNELKNELHTLLLNNKIERVLIALENQEKFADKIFHLKKQFNQNEEENAVKLKTSEAYKVEGNRITSVLLGIIKEL